MNFISDFDESSLNDIKQLNKFIEQSVIDDQFIGEVSLPLVNGGKRLRPILFLTCAKSQSKNFSLNDNLPLATAIELIHTATLIHDDILDQSKIRRGIETLNCKFNPKIALLIGDFLFAKAFQLVAENNYNEQVALVLSKLVKNLCIGEITQDRSIFQVPTLSQYYNKIHLKTAVFLASCCKLGGIVADLNQNEIQSLTNYGINLGLAFQIVDDLLDFFGDVNTTGKALGGDFKSGVITLPIIHALKVSNKSDKLKKIVTSQNISDDDILTAIEIIKATDAEDYCKARAYAHIEAARINLIPSLGKSTILMLDRIADFVVDRTW